LTSRETEEVESRSDIRLSNEIETSTVESTSRERVLTNLSEGEKLRLSIAKITQKKLEKADPESRAVKQECLAFLSQDNIEIISERIGEAALSNHRKHSSKYLINCNDKQKQMLYFELQQYIELIRISILTGKYGRMQAPAINQSVLDREVYVSGIMALKEEIPENISSSARCKIEERIDYLVNRIG